MEAETGSVLFEYNSYLPRSPASTIKLLLMLVVMEEIEDLKVNLDEPVTVSQEASRIGGSQVYLKEGEVFRLGELMEAIAISSANDACVAVAEYISGTAEEFVELMNQRSKRLGLFNSVCVNVHGLDDTPLDNGNVTTAYDLAVVSKNLLYHSKVIEWAVQRERPFRRGQFRLFNTNKLLGQYRGLNGLKTGYTNRAGFCLVGTAERKDMSLISVVLGAPDEETRYIETRKLLDHGFQNFVKMRILRSGQNAGIVELREGSQSHVQALVQDEYIAVLRKGDDSRMRRQLEYRENIVAPVRKGEVIGSLSVYIGERSVFKTDLVAAEEVSRLRWWDRLKLWLP
tara:strand:- start:252 stop:1277 length:1026 start_codon:yes stop_codon:yes gene_type:complete